MKHLFVIAAVILTACGLFLLGCPSAPSSVDAGVHRYGATSTDTVTATTVTVTSSLILDGGTDGQVLTQCNGVVCLTTPSTFAPGVTTRLTALDANHIHASDTGNGVNLQNLTLSSAAAFQLATPGIVGNAILGGITSAGVLGQTHEATVATSGFTDLPSSGWTIEAWYRAWSNIVGNLLMVSNNVGANVNLSAQSGSNVINAKVRTSTTLYSLTPSSVYTGQGVWHYAATTYDGASFTLWLDGQVISQIAATGTTDWNIGTNSIFALWNDPNGATAGFVGELSRVRISNIVRSKTYLEGVWQKAMYF